MREIDILWRGGRDGGAVAVFSTVQGPGRALRGDCQEPGRDGTVQGSPSSSVSSLDGRHYEGRQAP